VAAVKVVLTPRAQDDLFSIYVWVAESAGVEVADAYDARLREACLRLVDFPRRGTPRDDLAPGVRSLVFERQAVIAYCVGEEGVRILAIAHRGRDLRDAFE
jgi:toxin ParE1/3/4